MKLTRRQFVSRAGLAAAGLAAARRARGKDAGVSAAELAADPRRPQYHLVPVANWMNDPNGPIYWRGAYHMFHQYNPDAAVWGDMHWGHAVSPDMVHWRHLPIALAPTPGGPDAGGCFTGSAVLDGERVAMLYTGVVPVEERDATIRGGSHSLRESQCIAFASDRELTAWTKRAEPVIAAPPPGLKVAGFRDPAPWREGDTWYMALGSGLEGKGAVLLYRSRDLLHWEYLHPLFVGAGAAATSEIDAGHMWECPDFFPLGDRHVLVHSNSWKSYWQSGRLDEETLTFHVERSGLLDYGSYYAAKTQTDRAGNRILWGWIMEDRPEAEYRAAGWACMMSLPRVLGLSADGDVEMKLAPEVDSLRGLRRALDLKGDESAVRRRLAGMRIENCCGEIECSLRRGAEPVAITICSPEMGDRAWLTCRYDPARGNEIRIEDKALPLSPQAKGEIQLRFLIDGSVIECFAAPLGALTKRFYYPGSTAPAIGVKFEGKTAGIVSLTMRQLTPISPNRLTT